VGTDGRNRVAPRLCSSRVADGLLKERDALFVSIEGGSWSIRGGHDGEEEIRCPILRDSNQDICRLEVVKILES